MSFFQGSRALGPRGCGLRSEYNIYETTCIHSLQRVWLARLSAHIIGGKVLEAEMEDLCDNSKVTVLSVKRLSESAFLPTRGSAHAAGYDLYRYYGHVYIEYK